jgi:hypothetical protein
MRKLAFAIAILTTFGIHAMAVAQRKHVKSPPPREIFLIDLSKPYVYLQIDHIGPREPRGENEPKEGIWLRLDNNCIVPIVVRTFGVPPHSPSGEIGVLDNVVANSESYAGISSTRFPAASTEPNWTAILGRPTSKTSHKNSNESVPSPHESGPSKMPHGYMLDASSLVTIYPGKSIYFSLPRNHVSSKWHAEIPFWFDLKVKSTIRSAYNYVALYEDDVVTETAPQDRINH